MQEGGEVTSTQQRAAHYGASPPTPPAMFARHGVNPAVVTARAEGAGDGNGEAGKTTDGEKTLLGLAVTKATGGRAWQKIPKTLQCII